MLFSIRLLKLFETFHLVKAPKNLFSISFRPEDHSTYACYCKKLAKMNLVFNKVLLGGCFYSLELTRFCVCCHVADLWLSTPCLKTRAFLFETHNILSSSQRRTIYMFQFFFFFLNCLTSTRTFSRPKSSPTFCLKIKKQALHYCNVKWQCFEIIKKLRDHSNIM